MYNDKDRALVACAPENVTVRLVEKSLDVGGDDFSGLVW